MKNKMKITAAMLCALLLLSSCTSDGTETTQPAVQTEADTFTEVSYPNEPSPFSVNGTDVSYDEYRYYMRGLMYQYDQGNADYWQNTSDEFKSIIKDSVLDTVRELYGMASLAEKYGIKVTDEQQKEIDESIQYVKDQYETEAAYYRYLDSMSLTEAVNINIAKNYYLRQNLYEYMTTDASDKIISPSEDLVRKFIENYMLCADRIYISNDYGEDLNENETLIKQIKEKLDNGEDFNKLKSAHSEDVNVSDNTSGVYFYKGDYDDYYYEETLKLKEGETSDIISTPFGYMIIKRYPHDEKYITENLDGEFASSYTAHMFNFAIEKEIEKQNIVFGEGYDSLSVENIK